MASSRRTWGRLARYLPFEWLVDCERSGQGISVLDPICPFLYGGIRVYATREAKCPEFRRFLFSRIFAIIDGVKPSQKYSIDERISAWQDWGRVCFYCDVPLSRPGTKAGRKTHFDHLIPDALGGSDELENLRPSCRRCNCDKSTTSLDVFVERKLASVRRQESRLVALGELLAKLEPEESNLEI